MARGFLFLILMTLAWMVAAQDQGSIGVPVFPVKGEAAADTPAHETGRVAGETLARWRQAMTRAEELPEALLISWAQTFKGKRKERTLSRGEKNPGASGFSVLKKSSASPFDGEPDPFIWLDLFSRSHGVSLIFDDLGGVTWGGAPCRLVRFSGLMGGEPAMVPQRWEGKLWVDGEGRIQHLEAEPVGQARRLQVIEDQHRRAMSWFGIKFKKRPLGITWSVTFGPGPEGLWLPTLSRYSTFKVDHKGRRTPLKEQVDRFMNPRLAGVKVETDFTGLKDGKDTPAPGIPSDGTP